MRSLQTRVSRLEAVAEDRSQAVAVVRVGALNDAGRSAALHLASEEGCDVSGLVIAITDPTTRERTTFDEWSSTIRARGNWWWM
jgi:hypothetical protein